MLLAHRGRTAGGEQQEAKRVGGSGCINVAGYAWGYFLPEKQQAAVVAGT